MTNDFLEDVEATKAHLAVMIAKEKLSGEFLLASVVQDSLLYNLHHHADSSELMRIAHDAAMVSIESAAEHMYLSQFTVHESMRGVMLSMVSLGGDPVLTAVAVATGGLAGLKLVAGDSVMSYTGSIASGICSAVDDMGISRTNVQRVTEHLTRQAALWVAQ